MINSFFCLFIMSCPYSHKCSSAVDSWMSQSAFLSFVILAPSAILPRSEVQVIDFCLLAFVLVKLMADHIMIQKI